MENAFELTPRTRDYRALLCHSRSQGPLRINLPDILAYGSLSNQPYVGHYSYITPQSLLAILLTFPRRRLPPISLSVSQTSAQSNENLLKTRENVCCETILQGCAKAKEWSLGCVISCLAARESQEVGFTQPRDHSFAQHCPH